MTQQKVFGSCAHAHLCVGHTHEDVDACLALVTSALNGADSLETPNDVCKVISERLTPVFAKRGIDFEIEIVETVPCLELNQNPQWHETDFCWIIWIFPFQFEIGTTVTEIRDWVSILPDNVTLKNCYRDRKPQEGVEPMKVPQSFTLVSREGLRHHYYLLCCFDLWGFKALHSNHEKNVEILHAASPGLRLPGMPNRGADLPKDERQPRSMRGQGDDGRDIFCLVKQNMSDSFLSQCPILVWPAALMRRTNEFFENINDPQLSVTGEFTPERREELLLLKRNIEKDFPHMTRAMKYYEDALNPALQRSAFPRITFCNYASADPGRWHRINLGQRAPPPRPHALQVVYHHRARV